MQKIPMSSPDLTDAERQTVADVMNTPMLSMGQRVKDFEQAFCERMGAKHAIAVNSGTAGLHLCIRAAGISEGDLVITTPFSFVASSNVMLFENAIPLFVDVDPKTGNINTELVKDAIENTQKYLPRKGANSYAKIKAILPVDVFGQPADMDKIMAHAKEHNLIVIEDSCEALGAEYKGNPAGMLGDFGVFAFYPNKQMTTGEGGMVVTNHDEHADYMRAMRNQGRAPGDTWLTHTYLGFNYRLDEMSAALGAVQISRLEEMLEKRAQVANAYASRLKDVEGIETQFIAKSTSKMSWFVYVVRFDKNINRDELAQKLIAKGIPVRPYFAPIHLQPYMVKQFGYQRGDFPITEDLGNRSLALPFSGVMSEAQVVQVCESIAELLE
ncbi:MAG TPA: DegT/DnrJ/EryC1/StrS family aminotransferase [Anaerolineales bacterium]|nr:DegT/DnrJ/EryC1/StrS family aminotransferase [Anaerolineales bacterium]